MTMKCEKTNIRECAIKSCEARIKHLQNAPPHYHGKRQRLREIELEKVKIAALTLTPPNEPLTLEQLREMDGEPVWVEDVRHWALIDIEKGGQWDGVPFAIWTENGVRFCYNILDRNLLCYRRPPEGEEKI